MLSLSSAPRSDSSRRNARTTTYGQSPQVLKTHNINSFRFRTYSVVEALLKTRNLNLFRMCTYRKSNRNSFVLRTYKKSGGVGGGRTLPSAFRLLRSAFRLPPFVPPPSRRHPAAGRRGAIALLNATPRSTRTVTVDNGTEFHGYKAIEASTGVTFFFATPHHSWERGTNENTNGLIRQYAPKRTSLARLTQADCDRIAAKLNNRPRKRLGFRTPAECYDTDSAT